MSIYRLLGLYFKANVDDLEAARLEPFKEGGESDGLAGNVAISEMTCPFLYQQIRAICSLKNDKRLFRKRGTTKSFESGMFSSEFFFSSSSAIFLLISGLFWLA